MILCGYTSTTKVVNGTKIQKTLVEFNDEEKEEFKLIQKLFIFLHVLWI